MTAERPADGIAALGEIVAAPTGKLRLADDNPRRIPPAAIDAVARSLARFGWQQPIVVDPNYEVLAGHTRLQAARKLGLGSVPVVIADGLTDDEARAFRIADNRTHDYSTWDMPILVDQLDELADDFSEVLGLADWQALVDSLDDGGDLNVPDGPADDTDTGDGPDDDLDDDDADDTDLDLGGLAKTQGGFEIVVCFHSKEQADAAGPVILDLDGAYDVRYKR